MNSKSFSSKLWLLFTALIMSVTAAAQNFEATGRVVDSSNSQPVPGVTVLVKGTTTGTITDFDGNFAVKTSEGAPLIFSFIGYTTQELPAAKGMSVSLAPDNQELEDVVVIGYGTQRKGDVTSAITSVKSEDFVKGNINNAADLVKGKVAGLTITNGSGDPSSSSAIRLRGVISLSGSNTPLVLVDGIEGSLTTVSPEDIESIDVLKDASAAAIYGTRGAAGVIIITTKQGKRDAETTVNYSGYASWSGFANTLDMMDGDDVRAGLTDFKDKGYDTDWLDAITRTAFTHNHDVSISGGTKKTSYDASFSYRDQNGVFINTYAKEMRFTGGLAHWFCNDILKLQFNIVKRWHENGPVDAAGSYVYRNAIMRNPTEPIYNEDGSYYEDMSINYYMNPVALLKEKTGEYKTETTRLTGNVTVEPIKGWQTNLMLSTDRYNAHDEGYYTSKYYDQILNGHTGYAYHSYNYSKTDNLEITSNYKHTWNDNHRFDALIGYSYQYDMAEGFNANNTDFSSDYFEYNNLGVGGYLKKGKAGMGSYKNDSKLIGFFGRVSYGYADRYNLLVSLRREGSSKFGENNKWGNFPSASLGWTISNEGFMDNADWVSNLKLRAGFGVTGVIPNDSYISLTRWALGDTYYYDNGEWKQALVIASNPNPDLKWEVSKEVNVGLDFSFLEGRVGGSVDFYNKNTSDMLWEYDVPTPPNLYSTTLANVGEMRNRGIEVALNGTPFERQDGVTWKTTVTMAWNSNKLVSLSNDLYETANQHDEAYLGEPVDRPTQRIEVGKALGQWYGCHTSGLSENGMWLIQNQETGEYEEFTQNMQTEDKYHTYLGNAIPKMNLGWSNYVAFKGFDLNLQFTGQFGFKILNEARVYYENNACTYNRLKDAAKPKNGYVLSVAQKQSFNDYYLEDGDFLKLTSATLGYTVPLQENKYIKNIYVYASGNNLFTITGYSGLDPELKNDDPLNSGIDRRDKYPTLRTFTLGAKFTF